MTYKTNNMQTIFKGVAVLSLVVFMAACGGGNDKDAQLNKKKAELEKLKEQEQALSGKIATLQDEITVLDPNLAPVKTKLVTLGKIVKDTFTHYIELQGKVDAQNVAYVAPRGQGGVVRAIYVKQGDVVKKGQLLLKLDDVLLKQSVVAARQQMSGLKAQLDQAESIYKRQQNLWSQNIGTEIQVLNAKTNVEALQSQYNAAGANIKLAEEQLNTTNVYAEVSGVANQVDIKVGEFFTAGDKIQIVSNNDLKVKANVPENYLDRVRVGSTLLITLPEADNKTVATKVSVAGRVIDPVSRSFYVEAKLPANKDLRPNQIALVRIKDYSSLDAITIPVNTLQNDEDGKYVLVAETENGQLVARKKPVTIGVLYGNKLEVKSGLSAGDQIITDGFQGLYDGQPIATSASE